MASAPVATDRSFIVAPGNYSLSSLFPNVESYGGSLLYTPSLTDKNHEVRVARDDIVRQARQAERASELIRAGIDRHADMVVGAMLRVHPQPDWDLLGIDDKEERKRIVREMRRAFYDWAYDSRLLCDAEGHYNFSGMMWMAFRNLAGPDAETALVIHYDEAREQRLKARWATYVTVVDPDRLGTPAEKADQEAEGKIFQGRELDENGRMTGMYVRKKHPNESGYTGLANDYVYVPRETSFGRPMAIHWFIKTRGRQQRGISPLATVLKATNMLRKFDESYLASAVINSQLATYIKTSSSAKVVAQNLAPAAGTSADEAWSLFGKKVDYYDKAKFKVGPARIPVLPIDDEIVMTAVNRAIEDPSAFRNGHIREQASAVGNGFEQMSLNYSESTYSSARAGELQVWRGVMRVRTMFTGHVASQIYGCIIEEAIAKGRVVLPAGAPPFQEHRTAWTGAAWTGPGMIWIDPLKEAKAYETLLNLKVTTRGRIAAERGDDFFEILEEEAAEREAADELGITLDMLMPGQVDPNAEGDAVETSASGVPKTKRRTSGGAPARDGDGDGAVEEEE